MSEKFVEIREVGPREGFQILPQVLPTTEKLKLINALSATGVKEIEVTSFVRADKVPQMADSQELVALLPETQNVKFIGLYLNQTGFKRAILEKMLTTKAWLYTATSDEFLKKNSNTSKEKLLTELDSWLALFKENQLQDVAIMISTAFGCAYEGEKKDSDIIATLKPYLEKLAKFPIREISLADTVGLGTPQSVDSALKALRKVYNGKISLHLHDTRGLALTNVYVALEHGVRIFESSVGGIGGCPFTKGASGNVATEDLINLLHSLGFKTGIDFKSYVAASKVAEQIIGHKLPGRICNAM